MASAVERAAMYRGELMELLLSVAESAHRLIGKIRFFELQRRAQPAASDGGQIQSDDGGLQPGCPSCSAHPHNRQQASNGIDTRQSQTAPAWASITSPRRWHEFSATCCQIDESAPIDEGCVA